MVISMKKIISVILAAGMAAAMLSSCVMREDKYADSLRVGTTELPKNLNPYSSMEASATFFVGLLYLHARNQRIYPLA